MTTPNHLALSKYTELSLEVYEMDGKNLEGWEFVDDSDNLVGERNTGYFGALYKRELTDEGGQQKTEFKRLISSNISLTFFQRNYVK
jgi:hypothetical protein